MFCSALSSLRFSFRFWCARVLTVALTGISAARAGLPTVEGPKSSTDSSLYGQISGYINDGIVLAGLVLAAAAMLPCWQWAMPLSLFFLKFAITKRPGGNSGCWSL